MANRRASTAAFFVIGGIAMTRVAHAQSSWEYTYFANASPTSTQLPAADRWTLTQSGGKVAIQNGQATFTTGRNKQREYRRTSAIDANLDADELAIEFRAVTSTTRTWGMVVGYRYRTSSAFANVGVWVRPSDIVVEATGIGGGGTLTVPIASGAHVYRIRKSDALSQVSVSIDGTEAWSAAIPTGATFPGDIPALNVFIGDETTTTLDYLAYTISPFVEPSPEPYRMPFYGSYLISQGPECPGAGGHTGRNAEAIDYALPVGTLVAAAAAGEVTFAGLGKGQQADAGLWVEVTHPDASKTAYLHLSSLQQGLNVGTFVGAGQPLGYSGGDPTDQPNAGSSTGPHLHFRALDTSGTAISVRTIPTTTWLSGTPEDVCLSATTSDGRTYFGEGFGQ